MFWAFHPALNRAFWGEPASGNIFGHDPKLIAGILHALRYPILYLAIVPLASFMIESVFVQPRRWHWACRSPVSA